MNGDDRLPPLGFRQRGPVPTGTRLLLIRHGECVANALGRAGGPLGDGGLTPLGQRQCEVLRDRLLASDELRDARAFYASTLPRARETAAILRPAVPARLSLQLDDALVELRVGEADGLSWEEVAGRFESPDWDLHPEHPCAPGGESLLDFYDRCARAIDDLVTRHPGELVVVVTHGGFIEQAMKIYHRVDARVRLQPRIENCSMTEIEFRGDYRRLLRYNDLAPLPVTSSS
ncbi:MAG: histidine phosphatase family protein [Acidobacteriota bacterium]|nr:histidine phosphatase family protein [Acidobacteriota bacterium]MDE3044436.1 histidine phosphatase family protein [Acidobacteriota bacterium]